MGTLYPCLLWPSNSLHCPAYHQPERERWQACERSRGKQKLQRGIEEVRAAPLLSMFYYRVPSGGPSEAWDHRSALPTGPVGCQNVSTGWFVILFVRARFLHTGDCVVPVGFGTCLLWFSWFSHWFYSTPPSLFWLPSDWGAGSCFRQPWLVTL